MNFLDKFNKHIITSILLIFVVFIFINFLFSVYNTIKYPKIDIIYILLFFGLFSFFIFKIVRGNILQNITEKKFIIIISITTFLFGVISIFLIDNILIGDPKWYNETALNFLNSNQKMNFADIGLRRTIFYVTPIYWLLPKNILSIKIINLFLTILTSLIFYKTLRLNNVDVLVSRLAIIIFTLIPIRYSNINIPSHDLVAIFCIMLILFFITISIKSLLNKNKNGFILLSILVGVVVFIIEFQRSIGIFILMSLLVTSFLFLLKKERQIFKNLLINLFVILITFISLNFIVKKSEFYKPIENARYSIQTMIFSYNKLGTFGRYIDGIESRNQLFPKVVEKDLKTEFAIGHYISQIKQQPLEYFKLIVKKSVTLLNFPGVKWLTYEKDEKLGSTINDKVQYFNMFFKILFFFFIILGIIYLFFEKNKNILILFLMSFSVIFSFILIFLSEVNQSYSFLILPSLCIYSAIGVKYLITFNLPKSLKDTFKILLIEIKRFVTFENKFILKNLMFTCLIILVLYSSIYVLWNYIPFKTITNSNINLSINNKKVNLKTTTNYESILKLNDTVNTILVSKTKETFENQLFFLKHYFNQEVLVTNNLDTIYNYSYFNSKDTLIYYLCQFKLANEKDYLSIKVKNKTTINRIYLSHYFTYK